MNPNEGDDFDAIPDAQDIRLLLRSVYDMVILQAKPEG